MENKVILFFSYFKHKLKYFFFKLLLFFFYKARLVFSQ